MTTHSDTEERAIRRLIAEIDELDHWRDRVGRRVIYAFLGTFAFALTLLAYVVVYEGAPRHLGYPAGPRVPGVLHRTPR